MSSALSSPPEALDADAIARAVAYLVDVEPRFAPVVAQHGMPSLRAGTVGFVGLLQIVTDQFLSLAAARAIWMRVEEAAQPLTPQAMLTLPEERLLALGLSRAKVKSFKGIAKAFASGSHSAEMIAAADDTTARKMLLALPGIGPWSADIYLLSALLRPDAWPVGDLALQAAAQHLFSLRKRPDAKRMTTLGKPFSPYRAVAARLLWSHYRSLKALPQA